MVACTEGITTFCKYAFCPIGTADGINAFSRPSQDKGLQNCGNAPLAQYVALPPPQLPDNTCICLVF
jgi:hypothetical protein